MPFSSKYHCHRNFSDFVTKGRRNIAPLFASDARNFRYPRPRPSPSMSALALKQTHAGHESMSAKAKIGHMRAQSHVRFGPKADIINFKATVKQLDVLITLKAQERLQPSQHELHSHGSYNEPHKTGDHGLRSATKMRPDLCGEKQNR